MIDIPECLTSEWDVDYYEQAISLRQKMDSETEIVINSGTVIIRSEPETYDDEPAFTEFYLSPQQLRALADVQESLTKLLEVQNGVHNPE